MNFVLQAHHGRQSMYRFRISVKKQAISSILARSQRRAHVIDFYCSQVSRREFRLLEALANDFCIQASTHKFIQL